MAVSLPKQDIYFQLNGQITENAIHKITVGDKPVWKNNLVD